MLKKIGTVTIGQAPRTDVTPDLKAILDKDVEIIESGALDGLSKAEIAEFAPQTGDYVLVTRLVDGTSVQVAERFITPRIADKIKEHFSNGIQVVLLLCTGEFPDLGVDGLLISPQKILYGVAEAVGRGRRIGVLTPSKEQIEQAERRWSAIGSEVKVIAASPYVNGLSSVEEAAAELTKWGTELTVLDCIGYTKTMQEIVSRITNKPTILGRGIAARAAAELLS